MPLDDGFGLHDRQGGSPVPPEPRQQYPEEAVAEAEFRTFYGLLEHRHLLSQCEVLDGCGSAAENERSQEEKDGLDDAHALVLPQLPNRQSDWHVSA